MLNAIHVLDELTRSRGTYLHERGASRELQLANGATYCIVEAL